MVVAKTRDTIYNVDYTGNYGSQGLFYAHYTIETINYLCNITLTMKFLDEDHATIESNSKRIIDLPAGAGQTVRFDFSSGNVFKIRYSQIVVNATTTYYENVFR